MGSVTYIPETIPVALPEQQGRCVGMVGYIDRQTVTASTRSYYWIARCCQHNNWQKKGERVIIVFSRGGRWWLMRCGWGICTCNPSHDCPRWRSVSSDTPRICRLTLMVLPCAAAGFWAAVGLQCCMIIAACLSHALRSLSAVIMTLLANHINLASHMQVITLIWLVLGVLARQKKIRLEVKKCPYLLPRCHKTRSLVHHTTSLFQ